MSGAFIVKLTVRERGEYLSAVSADVPGLHVYGKSAEDVRQSAMRAIPRLLRVNRQMQVTVSPTDDLSEIRVKPV